MSHWDVDTAAQIMDLIRNRLSVEVPAANTDLIASGLLDSLALVTLITALEEAFACELPLDDFDLERFRSVERIAEFLRSAGVLEVKRTS
jgi:D-alanine--poly(phosphoribitol) ligase subunit 2